MWLREYCRATEINSFLERMVFAESLLYFMLLGESKKKLDIMVEIQGYL